MQNLINDPDGIQLMMEMQSNPRVRMSKLNIMRMCTKLHALLISFVRPTLYVLPSRSSLSGWQVMQAAMEMSTGGEAAANKYANDPEVMKYMEKLQRLMESKM